MVGVSETKANKKQNEEMMKPEFKKLKNGMGLLAIENPASQVLSINIMVKVGSADEEHDEWGISHVIEHMIFKGSRNLPKPGMIASEVEGSGGEINAYTSFDHTLYFINMASKFSKKGIEILADAVMNPLFDEKELELEKQVIIEEIMRSKDNPSSVVNENLFKTAYRNYPYGHAIIGTEKHVRSFTREKIMSFYRKWYTPDNMAIIFAGQLPKDFKSLIEKTFGSMRQTQKNPQRSKVPELTRSQTRIIVEKRNVQNSYLSIGFVIPPIDHEDTPSLDILSHILGGADSSRLEQEIKERKGLVHHISTMAYTPRDDGIFVISALFSSEKTKELMCEISREIQKISTHGVSQSELERAKLNIRATQVYDKETAGGEAAKFAYYLATTGNPDFEKKYFSNLNEITTEKIVEICKKYLDPKKCAISLLFPDRSHHPSAESIKGSFIGAVKKGSASHRKNNSPLQIKISKSGATFVIQEIKHLPIISISAFAKGGLRYEKRSTNGITTLASRIIEKGTLNLSALDIAKEQERIAGSISGVGGRNSVGVRCEFLSSFVDNGFKLFSDVLSHPSFMDDEVEKEKKIQLQEIKDESDQLHTKAFNNFLKLLFDEHPYGMPIIGEEKSVKSLTPSALRDFYFNSVNKDGLVISVVGDISSDEAIERLEASIVDLPKKALKKVVVPRLKGISSIKKIDERVKGKEQAHIVIGFKGTTLDSPDKHPLGVANSILSGQGGRLFLELRDRLGLAYAIYSSNVEGVEPGYICIYIATDPKKIDFTIEAIFKELKLLLSKGVTEEEVNRAKQYIIGSFAIDMQRFEGLSMKYAINELYELGAESVLTFPERIMKVTKREIDRAVKKHIDLDAYAISILRP